MERGSAVLERAGLHGGGHPMFDLLPTRFLSAAKLGGKCGVKNPNFDVQQDALSLNYV